MSQILVSIIVPCRNEKAFIPGLIRNVLDQRDLPGEIEVLISDGMSTDGSSELLAQICAANKKIKVISNPKEIVSAGLNRAVQGARGQIILRLDVHTQYASDYVSRCVKALQETDADNVGGPWIAKGSHYLSRAIAAAFQSAFAIGGARGHMSEYEGPVDTVYLGCWKREAFETFGLFDEELVRNQDDEHNLRITRAGGEIWQTPQIKSWYRPRGSLSALFKQYMQYGYWKVRVIQKHKLPASWRHLVPGAFVFTLILLLILTILSIIINGPSSLVHFWNSSFRLQVSCLPLLLLASQLGSYAAAILLASVQTAAKTEWKLLPALPLVFPCYHLGYGWGFLRGIIDFVILRSPPAKTFTKLTRPVDAITR